MDVVIFGLKLTINPIAFTLKIGSFSWEIYWYGIIIALGFLLALVYGLRNYKRFNLDLDRMLDVVIVTVPVSVLCARAYYLIFDGEKLNGIGEFFGFGDGRGFSGLAIYGAVIGAFACGALMCYIRKVNILDMFDLGALGFLIGQGIGRWGNFINQEAFGGPTGSSWWGMTSENVVTDFYLKGYDVNALAHPCFLYESVWCIVGFFIIHKLSRKRKYSGQVALMYAAWYGLGRGFIELFRTDSLMLGPFKVSALLSFLLTISATTLLIYFHKKQKETVTDKDYTAVFEDNADKISKENENDKDN